MLYPVAMWGLSRALLCAVMVLLVPAVSSGEGTVFGWDVFSAWDSIHYLQIVTNGYVGDGEALDPNLAFFPLFPGAIWAIASLGIPPLAAGVIVSNLGLLGAAICLYHWMCERHTVSVARWVTAVLLWCPFSLFGTVIYTEGVFLFFSIAALSACDRKRYLEAGLWGAFATATRISGIALIPAFWLVAWQRRREPEVRWAGAAGLFVALGLLAYMLYCWVAFGDPLAFVTVQHLFWERSRGVNGADWLVLLAQVLVGPVNVENGLFADPWYPVGMAAIALLSATLWRTRKAIGEIRAGSILFVLFVAAWLIAGDPFVNVLAILGGIVVLWKSRRSLGLLLASYAAFSVVIILASGSVTSAERYMYTIVPLSIAVGQWLSHHRRWGYAVFSFFAILLVTFSIRFAQNQWVA